MCMVKFDVLKAVDDCFRGMNNLRRWTEFFQEARYNELSKQALNCMVTFIVAKKCEQAGKKIHWERFPKIAIFRGFQKMGLADVTHNTYANIVENKMNGELENFYRVIGCKKIKDLVNDEKEAEKLQEFLVEGINTFEFEIYRVSSRIASLIEVVESEEKFNRNDYANKYAEIVSSIKDMEAKIPAVKGFINSSEYEILRKISSLRNQNRWALRSYRVDCSVLGHLFDTAVFAYLIALNNGMNEKMAAKMFFIGIWHDIAEAWTKDIPSPTKDAFEGFREASEEFEVECLNKYVYQMVDEFLGNAIKEVMLEEEAAKDFKALIKAADYLSADSECYRQLVAGTRDKYFRDRVLWGDLKKIEENPNTFIAGGLKELLKFWVDETRDVKMLG